MKISRFLIAAVFVVMLGARGFAADDDNIDFSKPDAMAAFGAVLAKRERFTESIVMLQKASSIDKSNFEDALVFETVPKLLAGAYEMRGWRYMNNAALNRALLDFSSSISLAPDTSLNAGSYENTALIYSMKGQYDKAIEYYSKSAVSGKGLQTHLSNMGFAYYLKGDLENAEKKLSEALVIKKDFAIALINIAQVYIAMNDIEKAKAAMAGLEKIPAGEDAGNERLALAIINKALVDKGKLPDSVETGRTASAALDKKDYKTALRYFLAQRILDPNNPSASRNIAVCYDRLNDRINAIEYYSRYLVIGRNKTDRAEVEASVRRLGATTEIKKAAGDNITIQASEKDCKGVLNSGFAAIEEGDFEAAEGDIKTARDCFLIVSGNIETANTVMTLSAGAKAALTAGRYDKALIYSEAGLESVEELPEKDRDPRLLASLFTNMAMVEKKYGRLEEALDYYTQALVAIEKIGGEEPEMFATINDNIGNLYQDMDENETALEYHLKALKIIEERYGSDGPERAIAYNNIAGSYFSLKDVKKAMEYAEKALAIMLKKSGEDSAEAAMAYDNIAGYFMEGNEFEKALDYRLKAKAIFEKALGEDNPETAALLSNLGYTYFKMGEYEKAVDSIQKALKIFLDNFDGNHPQVLSAYGGLAAVYKGMGDDYNASIYMNKARGKR